MLDFWTSRYPSCPFSTANAGSPTAKCGEAVLGLDIVCAVAVLTGEWECEWQLQCAAGDSDGV